MNTPLQTLTQWLESKSIRVSPYELINEDGEFIQMGGMKLINAPEAVSSFTDNLEILQNMLGFSDENMQEMIVHLDLSALNKEFQVPYGSDDFKVVVASDDDFVAVIYKQKKKLQKINFKDPVTFINVLTREFSHLDLMNRCSTMSNRELFEHPSAYYHDRPNYLQSSPRVYKGVKFFVGKSTFTNLYPEMGLPDIEFYRGFITGNKEHCDIFGAYHDTLEEAEAEIQGFIEERYLTAPETTESLTEEVTQAEQSKGHVLVVVSFILILAYVGYWLSKQ